MRSDLLLTTQSFIDTFSAPNYAERSKTVARDPASSKTDLKQSKSDESFEAFMNDLKARHEAEQSRKSASQDNVAEKNTQKKDQIKADTTTPFLTQIASTNTTTEDQGEVSDDIVFDIYTQMEEIIQELEQLMAAQDKGEQSTITTEIPEENLDSLKDLKILSLFTRVNEDTDDQTAQAPKDVLMQAMSDLRRIIEDNKEGLITLNKAPEELAELQRIIEDILKAQIDKQNQKMLEELAAQWATIEIVKPETTQLNEASLAQNENTEIVDEQTSFTQNKSLNDLSSRYEDRYQINRYAKDSQSAIPTDPQTDSAKTNPKDIASSTSQNKSAEGTTDQTNKSELPFSKLLNGSSLPPLPIMTAQGDVLYTDQNGAVVAATQGNGVQPSLINNAAHSSHASQPHPATQAVVTTITKAFKAGETSEIKIQLDPPELGRVEVKMSIDQDNITRVVLTSEKAETHTLLQRDSHILQQLLTDSGLLPEGSSLSFELSDGNNQNFASDKGQKGHNSASGSDGYSEIIETTMDWHIDPRTGVMHYNILA